MVWVPIPIVILHTRLVNGDEKFIGFDIRTGDFENLLFVACRKVIFVRFFRRNPFTCN